ncbi:MAG: hypothetical protein AB8F65_01645 [Woeseiaceae bacterium]
MADSPVYFLLYVPVLAFLIWQVWSVRPSTRDQDDVEGSDDELH